MTEAGFQVNLTTAYSADAEGIVIGQEPEAGESAEESAFVTLWVSKGLNVRQIEREEVREMPDVRYLELDEARAVLEEAGITLSGVQMTYSDTVAEGVVIAQSMEPGIEIFKGQSIDVEVSMGPEPRETETQATEAETRPVPPTESEMYLSPEPPKKPEMNMIGIPTMSGLQ